MRLAQSRVLMSDDCIVDGGGMRVLVLSLNAAGNWPPERALIAALVERGHQVHVVSDVVHKQDVKGTGARFEPYRYAESRTPPPPGVRTLDHFINLTLLNPKHRDELLDAAARIQPDILAIDMMLWSAIAAAESLTTPSVILWHTILGGPPHAIKTPPEMLERLNAERLRLGLPKVASGVEQAARANAVLVFTPAQFDATYDDQLDNLHYVGPLACLPSHESGPNYDLPWPGDDQRPLVLVSFSTSDMGQADALQRVADALGELDVRGLLTVGSAMDPGALRLPRNVVVESFVPHAQVIRHASLVVTHAGHGTTMTAVAAGVPLLCMPMGRDQFNVSARVTANGLGRVVPQDAHAGEIRSVVAAILADERLADRCHRFAEGIDLEEGLASAVALFDNLG